MYGKVGIVGVTVDFVLKPLNKTAAADTLLEASPESEF